MPQASAQYFTLATLIYINVNILFLFYNSISINQVFVFVLNL